VAKKLFVGNLSFDTHDAELKELFTRAGSCVSAVIVMDRATGRSRGFGFVEMASDEEALRAVSELNGADLQGRAISVNEARERSERSERPEGRPPSFPARSQSFGPDRPPAGRGFRKDGKSRRGVRGRKRSI
jgi:RNA recognition motif-containing protein